MSDLHAPPPDPPTNGTSTATAGPTDSLLPGPTTTATTAKRQRRPSVRLGEIGEPPAAAASSDPYIRRTKHFKLPPGPTTTKDHHNPNKNPSNKTRNLTHLETLVGEGDNLETLAASIRKLNPNPNPNKSRRARRFRSSWTSKPDPDPSAAPAPADVPRSSGEGEDAGFRSEFDDLEGPAANSAGNAVDNNNVMSENDWNDAAASDRNGRCGLDEDDEEDGGGIRLWLNRLGLGRYAPVFEIHEVDDEVLPMLTLEDLKDMGINAVGSRRKMYCAIQKLKRNFT